MKLELYVHKVLRILLTIAAFAFIALGSYILYVHQVTPETQVTFQTTDPILHIAVITGCFTLSALCIAVALSYRKPLRELSHDAIMDDLEGMLKNTLQAVFAGVFSAVPAHRRADEIARHMSNQVQNLDARIAAILGKLGEAFLNATEGMGEAQLTDIQTKLAMVTKMETQAQTELADVTAIIEEMEDTLARFEILGEQNDITHARLCIALADIQRRMESLARVTESNVTPFSPRT